MFAPNSIKTLKSIKNYNQINQNTENLTKLPLKDDPSNKSMSKKGEEGESPNNYTLQDSKDIYEKTINTRVLLKGIYKGNIVYLCVIRN